MKKLLIAGLIMGAFASAHAKRLSEMMYLEIVTNPHALRCYEGTPRLEKLQKTLLDQKAALVKRQDQGSSRELDKEIDSYNDRWQAFKVEATAHNEDCKDF